MRRRCCRQRTFVKSPLTLPNCLFFVLFFEGGRVNFNSSGFANRRKVANFARLFAELCPGGARKALL